MKRDYTLPIAVLLITGTIIFGPDLKQFETKGTKLPPNKVWKDTTQRFSKVYEPFTGTPIDTNMDSLSRMYNKSDPAFDMYLNLNSEDTWHDYFNDYGDY